MGRHMVKLGGKEGKQKNKNKNRTANRVGLLGWTPADRLLCVCRSGCSSAVVRRRCADAWGGVVKYLLWLFVNAEHLRAYATGRVLPRPLYVRGSASPPIE